MKKTLIFVLFLSLPFLLSACSLNNDNNNENLVNEDFKKPDFGQPEEDPDIRGMVKSITGNQVTVLKINSEMRNNRENIASSSKKNEEGEETFSLNGNMPTSGPGGGMPGGGMRAGFAEGGEREDLMASLSEISEGEETIIIPIGIQMLKFSEQKERVAVEANLEDISTEKMLTIWLDDTIEDRNVAKFVLIN